MKELFNLAAGSTSKKRATRWYSWFFGGLTLPLLLAWLWNHQTPQPSALRDSTERSSLFQVAPAPAVPTPVPSSVPSRSQPAAGDSVAARTSQPLYSAVQVASTPPVTNTFDPAAFSPTISHGAPPPPAGKQFDPRFVQPASWLVPPPLSDEQIALQSRAMRARSDEEKREALDWAMKNNMPVRGETTNGATYELMAVREGVPSYVTTENANAAISTGVDPYLRSVYSDVSLTGEGWGIGVWEAGPARSTHRELYDGSSYHAVFVDLGAGPNYSNIPNESHATHVVGTLVGRGVTPAAKGMAPGAFAYVQDWNGYLSELLAEGASAPGQRRKVYVSNHSWGYVGGWYNYSSPPQIESVQYPFAGWYWHGQSGANESALFGQYGDEARNLDVATRMVPYHLPFMASGNSRGKSPGFLDVAYWPSPNRRYQSGIWGLTTGSAPGANGGSDGYDTIPTLANAKNIMTVGNLKDAISGGERSVNGINLVDSSSMGPTDDGRIKPDIVANGEELYSSDKGSDDDYSRKTGTSMATPNASGGAILLHEYYTRSTGQYMRASTLKALIIHTATDLDVPGPDYKTGWGLMDAGNALVTLFNHETQPAAHHIVEAVLSDATPEYRLGFTATNLSLLTATLCWTDVAGPSLSGLNNRTSAVVNDLDLRIIDPNGFVFYPARLDVNNPKAAATYGDNTKDTVEKVSFLALASGNYELVVSHKGTLQAPSDWNGNQLAGGSAQPFSLILDGQFEEDSGTLAEGLDQPPTRAFNLSTNRAWVYQTESTSVGGNRIASISPGHGKTHAFQTVSQGPQQLTFRWGVSSEANRDKLRFLINNVLVEEISGEVATKPHSRNLPSGTHTLRWEYVKDASVSSGQDRGWVDELQFLDPPPPPASYAQNFDSQALGSKEFNDFSKLTTDAPAVPGVHSINGQKRLRLTAADTLHTRAQFVLPALAPSTYGFFAQFDYLITPPDAGPIADGFGFYLKPAAAGIDSESNQVGGYSSGIGVEFITFGAPRHLIRINGAEQPGAYAESPATGVVTRVMIDYRTQPGKQGTLTVVAGGQTILDTVPVPADFQPTSTDVFAFAARTGGFGETLSIDNVQVRSRVSDERSYSQDFTEYANGARIFKDGSVLASDTGAARVNKNPNGRAFLIMTAAETPWTRTQWVLPGLVPSTYGFTARFSYAIAKPPTGQWADGFGFYLRPADEPVDVDNNQVGGYAKGLGVEFITFSNPRHQIRANNQVLPETYPVSPHVDGQFSAVVIDYDAYPGKTGSLSLNIGGTQVLSRVPVDYMTALDDVFTFVARTGGFSETLVIDDVQIIPKSQRPPGNVTARFMNRVGSALLVEVKWDTEPGGVYEVYVSQDLVNWQLTRTYTATSSTLGITNVSPADEDTRLFFKIVRQQ
ncbi:MAG: S8 family serine peptidase [Verrucomicrobiales bacterium]|nr:S8 family serine peptidase [Verrucomicrobiales bacterium]